MLSLIKSSVLFGAILSLTACASTTPPQNYLDAGARQHIKTVDGVLFAKQDEIGADITRNSTLTQLSALASGTTFIPLLVDLGVTGIRTAQANKLAKPMRESLKEYDYAWEFRKQIKQSLAGTTLDDLNEFDKFTIVRNEQPGLRGLLITESEADAVLVVDMKFGFTPSFDTLYVQSIVMLFPKKEELKPFQEKLDNNNILEFSDNIYRNQFSASLKTGLTDASKSENAAYWAELPQEKLIDLLERVGLRLSDGIANDISIDDLESDLNLIPEGYVLNTKYDNLNKKFATTRSLGSLEGIDAETEGNTDAQKDLTTESEPDIKTETASGS